MPVELDHVFLMTEVGAPAAEALIRHGLREGSRNVHPGQGTANRRFFFRNAMLELLWVTDAVEVRSPPIQPTHLAERWEGRAAGSPIGVSLRASAADPLPFATWPFQPPYLPPGVAIPMATSASRLDEPLLFAIPFGRRPDTFEPHKAEPLDHPAGVREVTAVAVCVPEPGSEELAAVVRAGHLQLRRGPHLLELELDGGARGVVHDLRPHLPLVLRW